jgi:serine protease Do
MFDDLRRFTRRAAGRVGGLAALVALAVGVAAPAARAQLPLPTDERGIPSLAPILEKVQAAVVSISVSGTVAQQNPLFDDPFFRRFFGVPDENQEREFQSAGSGVIVDAAGGLIITNHHVVDKADDITIVTMKGDRLDGELVGSDPKADVAVLRVKGQGLSAIPVGDSSVLKVGDFVVAIGNPFGLNQTVTSGIVSALGRSGLQIEEYEDFIQTDAAINPGNSGGALINMRGELVGINTAITSPGRAGNVGIGFAIPINMAKSIMRQLVEYGEVRRGQLGVGIQDLSPQLAKALKVPESSGAVVTEVVPGSSAEKAGLQRNDAIVAVNGKAVTSSGQLRNEIGLIELGKSVSLDVVRDGKKRTINAVVGAPVQTAATRAAAGELHPKLAGARFAEGSRLRRGDRGGVGVVEIEQNSAAEDFGLAEGDVIVEANRRKVETVEELADAVEGSEELVLLVERRGGAVYLYDE